ncbi:MAG: ADP-L-glycero-D-mannoheptose-6-epimerase [Brevundimonas sp. 32-68-21]|jgi:ADP-L-glycero-D-manno-heptose 6-epimerase|uniref:ADP-L-glycero-D-manno-heptose-6-epimerase n=2 Tax=Caulobacteraceae TaxID=76892 RepID=A0AB37EBI9_9CAUL|nr:ADP-L-glycero-D-manno-heptose-6-epimerase [Brevundimonas sp. BAL3]MBA4330554.1 ADP-glyceromanno-heptose 6-epimerase [Brevundimonas sp.]OYX79703.1 MAG: ADP-L-glycero-D-mannoheptose-6-epimerase [Brevundimonas sp. 32-68-21]QIH74704.1 ADP-glyceromanno-heptose 6-epimerase [Brevundimonas mediterranea]TAJ40907.1 MAG: ADP-glyceromanno-heptose 6-epimerase [Brevundimonas sp.]
MIVVTGGAGFIGSNIVARLTAETAYDVVVCDRLETADLAKWKNLAKHSIADFWAPEELFEQLERHAERIEAVVHMGAISSTTEPDADLILRTNFTLSRDLWDWCAIRDARMIYASSAATYGDGETGFKDDDDAESLSKLRPLNAYGYSKMLFDQYAVRQSDRGQAPPQWAGLKFFNVYGPNEGHKGGMKSVVAQIWPKVAAGETVSLFRSHNPNYADGGQLRDFVYVDDVVDIIEFLLQSPEVSGIFNAGSGQARSFDDLAKATFAAAGKAPSIEYVDMPEAIRDRYQYFTQARMDRIRAAGFEGQSTPLEEGVRRYVQNFLAQPDKYR